MLRSLQKGDVKQVQQCLASEPEATSQLFFDCGFEPALCCAIRHGCYPSICRLLLQHGADAFASDTRGYTPITCLASLELVVPSSLTPLGTPMFPSEQDVEFRSKRKRYLEVARLLIEAGARPHALDGARRSAVIVARARGNYAVARFLEYYLEVQGCITLLRAQGGQTPVGRLTADVLDGIAAYLVPRKFVDWSSVHMQLS